MVGDHYPYTLSIDEMNELASYKKDEIVEVNKSNFFLWSSSMKKPITIEKVGSQIDELPTLLNLFGVEYDSRMIVGKDILSDYPGLAIFSNRSWVSDYGTYFANTRTFIPKEGKVLDNQEEYINSMNQRVANGFSVSKMLMNTRYYNYIFDK
jgi:phosphoglycerol transferase MdoB-like AlkP superfamily enzyme